MHEAGKRINIANLIVRNTITSLSQAQDQVWLNWQYRTDHSINTGVSGMFLLLTFCR
jgi:hypothetical protein